MAFTSAYDGHGSHDLRTRLRQTMGGNKLDKTNELILAALALSSTEVPVLAMYGRRGQGLGDAH